MMTGNPDFHDAVKRVRSTCYTRNYENRGRVEELELRSVTKMMPGWNEPDRHILWIIELERRSCGNNWMILY
jgi:hypothetical protein